MLRHLWLHLWNLTRRHAPRSWIAPDATPIVKIGPGGDYVQSLEGSGRWSY